MNEIGIRIDVKFPSANEIKSQLQGIMNGVKLEIPVELDKDSLNGIKGKLGLLEKRKPIVLKLDTKIALASLQTVKNKVDALEKQLNKTHTFKVRVQDINMSSSLRDLMKAGETAKKKMGQVAVDNARALNKELQKQAKIEDDLAKKQKDAYKNRKDGGIDHTRTTKVVNPDGSTHTKKVKNGVLEEVITEMDGLKKHQNMLRQQERMMQDVIAEKRKLNNLESKLMGMDAGTLEKRNLQRQRDMQKKRANKAMSNYANAGFGDATKESSYKRAMTDDSYVMNNATSKKQDADRYNALKKIIDAENESYKTRKKIISAEGKEKEHLQEIEKRNQDNLKNLNKQLEGMGKLATFEKQQLENVRKNNSKSLGDAQRLQDIKQAKNEELSQLNREEEAYKRLEREQRKLYELKRKSSDLAIRGQNANANEKDVSDFNNARYLAREQQKAYQNAVKQAEVEGVMSDSVRKRLSDERSILQEDNRRSGNVARELNNKEQLGSLISQYKQGMSNIGSLQRDLVFAGREESKILQQQVDAEHQRLSSVKEQINAHSHMTQSRQKELNVLQQTIDKENQVNKQRQEARDRDYTYNRKNDGVINPAMTAFAGTAGFLAVLDQYEEYDSAITRIAKVADGGREAMAQYESQVFDTANGLGVSATDYNLAVEKWITSGKSLNEAQALGQKSMIGSMVGNISADDFVDYMSVPMAIYGKKTSSDDILNSMNEVSNNYAVEMRDLGEAYKRSSGTISDTGATFEEMTGMITGAQERTRLGGEVIGRALKGASSNYSLFKDADSGVQLTKRNKLKELLGFDVKDTSDVYDFFDKVSDKWDGLSKTEKNRVSNIMGGKDFQNIISQMVSGWDTVEEAKATALGEKDLDKDGSAYKEHSRQKDNVKAHINQVKNAWQELSKTIGESAGFKNVLDGVAGALSGITNLMGNENFLNIAKFALATTAVLALTNAFKMMFNLTKTGMGNIARDMNAIGNAMSMLTGKSGKKGSNANQFGNGNGSNGNSVIATGGRDNDGKNNGKGSNGKSGNSSSGSGSGSNGHTLIGAGGRTSSNNNDNTNGRNNSAGTGNSNSRTSGGLGGHTIIGGLGGRNSSAGTGGSSSTRPTGTTRYLSSMPVGTPQGKKVNRNALYTNPNTKKILGRREDINTVRMERKYRVKQPRNINVAGAIKNVATVGGKGVMKGVSTGGKIAGGLLHAVPYLGIGLTALDMMGVDTFGAIGKGVSAVGQGVNNVLGVQSNPAKPTPQTQSQFSTNGAKTTEKETKKNEKTKKKSRTTKKILKDGEKKGYLSAKEYNAVKKQMKAQEKELGYSSYDGTIDNKYSNNVEELKFRQAGIDRERKRQQGNTNTKASRNIKDNTKKDKQNFENIRGAQSNLRSAKEREAKAKEEYDNSSGLNRKAKEKSYQKAQERTSQARSQVKTAHKERRDNNQAIQKQAQGLLGQGKNLQFSKDATVSDKKSAYKAMASEQKKVEKTTKDLSKANKKLKGDTEVSAKAWDKMKKSLPKNKDTKAVRQMSNEEINKNEKSRKSAQKLLASTLKANKVKEKTGKQALKAVEESKKETKMRNKAHKEAEKEKRAERELASQKKKSAKASKQKAEASKKEASASKKSAKETNKETKAKDKSTKASKKSTKTEKASTSVRKKLANLLKKSAKELDKETKAKDKSTKASKKSAKTEKASSEVRKKLANLLKRSAKELDKEAKSKEKSAKASKKDADASKKSASSKSKSASASKKSGKASEKEAKSKNKSASASKKDADASKKNASSKSQEASASKKSGKAGEESAKGKKKDADASKKSADASKKNASSKGEEASATKDSASSADKSAGSKKKDADATDKSASSASKASGLIATLASMFGDNASQAGESATQIGNVNTKMGAMKDKKVKAEVVHDKSVVGWLDGVVGGISRLSSKTITLTVKKIGSALGIGGNSVSSASVSSNSVSSSSNSVGESSGLSASSNSVSSSSNATSASSSKKSTAKKSTSKKSTPKKASQMDGDVWRYYRRELKNSSLEDSVSRIEGIIESHDGDWNKIIHDNSNLIKELQKSTKSLEAYRTSKYSQLHSVMKRLKGYGFKFDKNKDITNMSRAKTFKGDKAEKVQTQIDLWKSIQEDVLSINQSIRDNKTRAKEAKDDTATKRLTKNIERSNRLLTRISNRGNATAMKNDIVNESDYTLAYSYKKQSVQNSKTNMNQLIDEFNRLSNIKPNSREDAEELYSQLETVSEEITSNAENIMTGREEMNDIQIARINNDLSKFSTALSETTATLATMNEIVSNGFASGSSLKDLGFQDTYRLSYERKKGLTQSQKDYVNTIDDVNEALYTFSGKYIDKSDKSRNYAETNVKKKAGLTNKGVSAKQEAKDNKYYYNTYEARIKKERDLKKAKADEKYNKTIASLKEKEKKAKTKSEKAKIAKQIKNAKDTRSKTYTNADNTYKKANLKYKEKYNQSMTASEKKAYKKLTGKTATVKTKTTAKTTKTLERKKIDKAKDSYKAKSEKLEKTFTSKLKKAKSAKDVTKIMKEYQASKHKLKNSYDKEIKHIKAYYAKYKKEKTKKISTAKTSYNKTIKKAKSEYNTAIKKAKKLKGTAKTKAIAKAKKAYNDKLSSAKGKYDKTVKSINEAYNKKMGAKAVTTKSTSTKKTTSTSSKSTTSTGKTTSKTVDDVETTNNEIPSSASSYEPKYVQMLANSYKVLDEEMDKLVNKYDKLLANAKTFDDYNNIADGFNLQSFDLQMKYAQATINANKLGMEEYKSQLKDATLTTSQIEEINDSINSLLSENNSLQSEINETIKSRYEYMFNAISRELSEFDVNKNDLEYFKSMIENLNPSDYEKQALVVGYELENEKGKNNSINGVLQSLQDQLKGLRVGSVEWQAINEQITSYRSELQASNLELVNMEKTLFNLKNSSIMESMEKTMFGGLNMEDFKEYSEKWVDGVSKEIQLNEMERRLTEAKSDLYRNRIKALGQQEKVSVAELDYLDKQIAVLEAQEKYDNVKKEKTVQTLKQKSDGSWGFEYVVDEDAEKSARQELENATLAMEESKKGVKTSYMEEIQSIVAKAESGKYSSVDEYKKALEGAGSQYKEFIDASEFANVEELLKAFSESKKEIDNITNVNTNNHEDGSGFNTDLITTFEDIKSDIVKGIKDGVTSTIETLFGKATSDSSNMTTINIDNLTFPNVKDKNDIQDAILNLPSLAKQSTSEK